MRPLPEFTKRRQNAVMNAQKRNRLAEFVFYLTVFAAIAVFALLQPFGNPPDEVNRYKVAQFICKYGFLPTGEEFEVAIGGYGGSYAFQPILPYMIQGWLTRLLSFFSVKEPFLLLASRFVNAAFGTAMAVYVRRLSKLLFENGLSSWLFCFLVMFLPQNLFLHSYVNTDSMAALSGAMILFACLSGWKEGWRRQESVTLTLGVIFCALSYYNAYGLIVMGILLFTASFWQDDRRPAPRFDYLGFLRKGLPIAAAVLVGIGWWFVRNFFIHDGDFLGLTARMANAARTALPEYNPLTRITVQDSGASLSQMLFSMDFFHFLWNSFVARFGPMTLPTFAFLYIWYYRIFIAGWLLSLLPFGSGGSLSGFTARKRALLHAGLLTAVLIPLGLCIYYSYTSDYQPQGRYIMPMLIPFMYFIALGFHKLGQIAEMAAGRYFPPLKRILPAAIKGGIMCFLFLSLILTLCGVVIPYFMENGLLWNSEWVYY